VSGTLEDGKSITATTGSWTGSAPISYAAQWRRCDSTGSSCVDIAGATAFTYGLTSADVGSALRVVVTATNDGGSSTATSAATAVVAPTLPALVARPTVSGQAKEGQTLTASAGSWSGTPTISYAYQWGRCDLADNSCVDLDGATAATYTLTGADVGEAIRVTVVASNAAGSTTASSVLTASVTALAVAPSNTNPPTIAGAAQDGATLTTNNGTWTGTAPFTFSYEWRRCHPAGDSCVAVDGATSASYVLTTADVGSTIRVAVSANNAGGTTTVASAVTAVVSAAPPNNAVAPTISGVAQDNKALTASSGNWTGSTPITYAYQWRRCNGSGQGCANISGATASIYTATTADVGATIRVMVTGSNVAGSSAATSAQTAAVASSGTATGTFGKTTVGASSTYASPDYKIVSTFALGESATVQKLTASVLGSGTSGTQVLKGLIYSDSGGAPGVLQAVSQEVSISFNSPKKWVDLVFPSPVVLSPGTYWLGLHAGTVTGTALVYYSFDTTTAFEQRTAFDTYSDGASTSFAAPTTRQRSMSIYATYSPSAPTPPSNVTLPTITGQPAVGSTLTASPGGWSGTAPISFAYQWRRCDTSGANCVDIVPSASPAYTLTAADFGRTIRASVTGSNAAGASSASSSATQTVAGAPQTDPVVMAAGDIACGTATVGGGCAQMATSNLIVNANPSAVLTLGDNQYDCGQLADFQNFYGPSWGRVKPKTFPTAGNHEYESSGDTTDSCYALPGGAPGYFGYFGAAASPQEASCTASCKGYYSFDLGNWHLVAINSNCDEVGGCGTGSPQDTWLRSDLAQTNKSCILAYWHHPRYASGGHAAESTTFAMSDIWNDLYNARADLVLAGHDHDYERFAQLGPSNPASGEPTVNAQTGIREIIVGTGGRSHGSFPSTTRVGSEIRDSTAYGVLKLTLHATSYDWQFVPVAGNSFTDAGTTTCH